MLLGLFACLSIAEAMAQGKETITGMVVNEAKLPIHDATIFVLTTKQEVVATSFTDVNGNFKINVDRSGQLQLKISHTGFQSYTSAPFEGANKDFGSIILSSATKNLKEVVVESKQNPVTLDGNTLVFNVDKTISAQGSNALDALRKAPGVFVDNDQTISLNGKPGAMILIDGKQTYLSSREIADLLRAMPASQLKSIEIINSPSAKYDAAGTGGMINIKTTKLQFKGFNGSITSNFAYGILVRQSEDLSFNYRKDKVNVFGSYNHAFGHYKYVYGAARLQGNGNYISDTDDTDKRKRMGSRLGIDYNLDKKNTIGILLTGNFIFGGGITDTHTQLLNNQQNLDAINDYYHQNTQRYNVNLNYKFEDTLGHSLNIDADYGYYQKDAGNFQTNLYTDLQQTLLNDHYYRTINGANIDLKAIKVDYTGNFWKGTIESGAKYSAIATDNDSRFFQVLSTNELLDEQRSNDFSFKEEILSGYINFKKPFGAWVFQGGLRVENTLSKGALTYQKSGAAVAENIHRNYTNFFPSLSLSAKLNKDHQLSFGYARRIDRPAYQDLNPFVYLLDELSFWSGNPFLKPQFSQRFNVLYTFRNTTIIGLNYSYSTNFRANITDAVDANKIVMVPRNVGIQKNYSLTLTQLATLAKWWSLTFNGVCYHLGNEVSFEQYQNFNLKQTAARLNLQQTFKLPFKFTGEIFNTYNSKRLSGANEIIRSSTQLDLGLQRNLLAGRASFRLIWADIYKGNKFNSMQQLPGLYLQSYGYYESRQVRLSFTYKFADASVKGPRNRNSALENENGRIK
ncbi:MAG: TonB-dependent receptor [Pedobacter sp.]